MENKLFISYGHSPEEMVGELLEKMQLAKMIPRGARIGLKPNLVLAKPASSGATTSPELVGGLLEYLQAKGFTDLVIAEGSWIGDTTERAFQACGYRELAEKYAVPLVDLQKDSWHEREVHGLKLKICDEMNKIDFLINLPVLKGHCQTKITCALKNLKGCIPNQEKRRFHALGLHKPIAYLNKALTSQLIIVDGLVGDLNFEEGGNPVRMDRLIAGFDPVLVDSYVAGLLGYLPADIPYITMAAEIGVGRVFSENEQLEVVRESHTFKKIPASRAIAGLAQHVIEKKACSACYGSLLHALDRLKERGLLAGLPKVSIGQGFKNVKSEGIGVGSCTAGFSSFVGGCPPPARAILDLLEQHVK